MKKKVAISCYLMPWDLDLALLSFNQLRKSLMYVNFNKFEIEFFCNLNLTDYHFNWEGKEEIKQFLIDKFISLNYIFDKNPLILNWSLIEGGVINGHLNLQKNIVNKHSHDYYLTFCPDIYFDEYLLNYMLEAAEKITNEYFVLTPEIPKLWDYTWDVISNPKYSDISYSKWHDIGVFDVIENNKKDGRLEVESIDVFKYAGWFDLYNKKYYEELCPPLKEFIGYGPWDTYSMNLASICKNKHKLDIQQYLLRGCTICEYKVGSVERDMMNGGFMRSYLKKLLLLNDNIPNQREEFEIKMVHYLEKGLQKLIDKNIIEEI